MGHVCSHGQGRQMSLGITLHDPDGFFWVKGARPMHGFSELRCCVPSGNCQAWAEDSQVADAGGRR